MIHLSRERLTVHETTPIADESTKAKQRPMTNGRIFTTPSVCPVRLFKGTRLSRPYQLCIVLLVKKTTNVRSMNAHDSENAKCQNVKTNSNAICEPKTNFISCVDGKNSIKQLNLGILITLMLTWWHSWNYTNFLVGACQTFSHSNYWRRQHCWNSGIETNRIFLMLNSCHLRR